MNIDRAEIVRLTEAKVIAAQRSQPMAHFLAAFEADSFGCF